MYSLRWGSICSIWHEKSSIWLVGVPFSGYSGLGSGAVCTDGGDSHGLWIRGVGEYLFYGMWRVFAADVDELRMQQKNVALHG